MPCCTQDELRRLEAERREAERNRHKDEREREKELELIRKQYLVSCMLMTLLCTCGNHSPGELANDCTVLQIAAQVSQSAILTQLGD